jgi:hypothetical protein
VLRAALGLLCFLVVVLGAVELLLRVTHFGSTPVSDGTYGPYRFDPELGWMAAPNAGGVQPSTNRTVALQHNRLGIRERELDEIPPDRILFLGDSFTWGFDAEVDERFTNLLQKELPQYGMVNAGVAGYGTDQQFLLMQRLWDKVKPKAVVVTFCVNNDRDDNSSNIRYHQFKPYFVRTPNGELQVRGYPLPLPSGYESSEGGWLEQLALARLVTDSFKRVRNRQVIVPDPTEQLFDMMQRMVEARGARLVVGLQHHGPRLEAHLKAGPIYPRALRKNLAGESSAIVHCRPLLPSLRRLPTHRKCPSIQRLSHADRFYRRARNCSCAHKTGVSCLVQCPVRGHIWDSTPGKVLKNHDKTASGAGGPNHRYWDS